MEDIKYWIAIDKAQVFDFQTALGACRLLGGPENLWKASTKALKDMGLRHEKADAFESRRKGINPDEEFEAICRLGIEALFLEDKRYPELLRQIPDPPLVLYVKGECSFPENGLAIVGSRKATSLGRKTAYGIGERVSLEGLTVISGLAYGIDVEAHKGALKSGGKAIAVLAGGLDDIYPQAHCQIADEIIGNGGALISEHPPGIRPQRHYFVGRNRIISGLSQGVLVVEAAERSGALITADFALDQGREIYAIPGSIYDINAKGTNKLIKNGAKAVTEARDILEDFGIQTQETKREALSEVEKNIIDLLREPRSLDDLLEKTTMSPKEISITLSLMEIRGVIGKNEGKFYLAPNKPL